MKSRETHLIDHLEELRQRIIKTLLVFILFLIAGFLFVQDIYDWLIRDLDAKLAVLGPGDIIWVYMMISGVLAIAATIPVAAFQAWRFVSPALTRNERRVALCYIPGLFLFFILGILFGYFVLFPLVLQFLIGLSAGHFQTMFTAEHYFRFMINLTLPFGFLFEMPLVVMFLTSLGILNPARLAKMRKVSYFALVVISIVITPPDFISDVMVIVPLLVLYELSISLSSFVYRKKLIGEAGAEAQG
ncbi:preprotein translocase subunit TatC [Bacillus glycinifermentans]|uniref:Sec-independent protein translocase protein TatC n=1 Tax=Bacillus glycinifermentans TaxID=1664069 RepID=A0A0J6EZ95_9BACI|nr:twin-arginine translocase subunit TatC [Bacillus glycinifermentans]KMM63143.1 preprotein translocase subunit TatC [Bacillus glycinifermentans]KRT95915.1 preprotein translocase subunit TatC [Bacillus glycinifermentans]MEC0484482.1 twin-arginine translocase subunit TatC [Bacillus glycinifermentans]MEC0496874.1 twin-arginine translocase subunit TatC [Bacillus glycinifermentans]MEC0539621.1 twin-arginine translocase subunit TatC [Bacillus glycinifermentans]